MKKLILFATIMLAVTFKAQETPNETKQLEDLISIAKSNPEQKASAVVQIMVLGAKSKDEKIKKSTDSVVAVLNNYALIDKIIEKSGVVLSKRISDLSKEDLKDYRLEDDKFRSITFITPKVSMTSKYAYLTIKEGLLNMRIVMEHYGSNWIFFKKVIILYNGKKIEYDAGDVKTYIGKGYVTETSDIKCSSEMIEAFREIVNTEKINVRLDGEKVNDFEMADKTKKSIRLALELYDKLKK